ncbi:MAG: hypothetical protein ABSA66_03530 [Roseiarcus sp.]|jgi:hypothetical protein
MKKKATSDRPSPEQRAEIEALTALPEDRINTGDIPEQRDWSGALFERARRLPLQRRAFPSRRVLF